MSAASRCSPEQSETRGGIPGQAEQALSPGRGGLLKQTCSPQGTLFSGRQMWPPGAGVCRRPASIPAAGTRLQCVCFKGQSAHVDVTLSRSGRTWEHGWTRVSESAG